MFVRPGGLGDAVLLIPAVQKIRKIYPVACIDILAEKRNAEVFNLIDLVDNIYCYDNPKDFIKVVKYKNYDVVFDTEQWHVTSSTLSRFLGKLTIGFDTNAREKNLNIKVKYSHNDYEVESFLNLVKAYCDYTNINFDRTWSYPFLNITITDQLYDICIFTGATIQYRKWLVEKYRNLIKLLSNKGYRLVLIGGDKDIEFNRKISHGLDIKDITGKTDLKETAKVIVASKLLFSTDSGILHLGAAVGVKTVSLFGPGIKKKWAPVGKNHFAINKNYPCSPCTIFGYTPKCRINAQCIKSITVEKVFKSIVKLLEG